MPAAIRSPRPVALALCAALTLAGAAIAQSGCRRPPGGASPAPSASAAALAPPAPPRPAGSAELAVLTPVVPGWKVSDWVVREVRAVDDGRMSLVVVNEKEDAQVRLDVVLLTDEGPRPPAMSAPYAIYYSLKRGSPDDAERLARWLAGVLAKHQDVARPPGLLPFQPRPREAEQL